MRKSYNELLAEYQQKQALLAEYPHSEAPGLIRMITTLSGRKLLAEHGEEQNAGNPYDLSDGWYFAEFEGGVALFVSYSAFEQGYEDSFGNRGADSPARVEYTLYSKEPLRG